MVDLNRDPRTDRGERITYTSSDAFEFTQILDQSAQPQEIFGDLELPEGATHGDGPFPCVAPSGSSRSPKISCGCLRGPHMETVRSPAW